MRDRSFLVVDDEPFSRDVVARMLSSLGAKRVAAVASGPEALEQLHKGEPFDCVITDFAMEPMNGLRLLKEIRTGTNGIRRDVPVVVLTGLSDAALVGTALALDANAFIAKPVAQRALADRLERVFSEPTAIRQVLAYAVIPTKVGPAVGQLAPAARPAQTERPAPAPIPSTPKPKHDKHHIDRVPLGSVLAQDLKTSTGAVLLGVGRTLSGPVIARLRDLREIGVLRDDTVWVHPPKR